MLNQESHHSMKRKSPPFRRALLSSGVMALSGLGDAILYPILPIYGKELGFSAFWIGVFLSVNRFVRILANTTMAMIIGKLGMKKVLIVTSTISVLTTMAYGLRIGLIGFLIARILWGLSYSGLKIATLNYAALAKKNFGLAFGATQSIKSLGGVSALLIGPWVMQSVGIQNGFFVLAAFALLGVFLTFQLSEIEVVAETVTNRRTFFPNPINLLVFILSLGIDGILVVTLADLFAADYHNPAALLVAVAFYLLLKRLFMVGVSVLAGFVSIKVDPTKLFNFAVFFCLLSFFLIAGGFLAAGVLLAFVFNAVVVTFAPLISISEGNHNALQAISGVSTWWDMGAAMGAFLGIILIEQLGRESLFLIIAGFISLTFINFILQNGKSNRAIL